MKKYILGFLFIAAAFLSSATSAFAETKDYQYTYERDLVHGSSGNAVVLLEFCLARIYDVQYGDASHYDIDGYYSSKTKSLVQNFQKRNALRADGILGKKTAAKVAEKCDLGQTKSSENFEAPFFKTTYVSKVKNNSQVDSNTSLSKNRKKASIAFSFKLKNSFKEDISLDTEKDFNFELNGKKISSKDLAETKGYKVFVFDKNQKQIKDTYVLSSGKTERFYVGVKIDLDQIKKPESKYSLRLVDLEWEMNGKDKLLSLGTTADTLVVEK